jgi:toxin FitB
VALAITAQAEVMYLLDTNMISELRRPGLHTSVVGWLSGIAADQVFISAVTLGELQAGVENVRRQDPGRAEIIESWIDRVAQSYNVLPMDGSAFRCWAKLMHGKPADLIADAMIAAIAAVHNLTVVTRNLSDFERLGCRLSTPSAELGMLPRARRSENWSVAAACQSIWSPPCAWRWGKVVRGQAA